MSPTATPPADNPPTHQRRKADRPQELLDAALALFVERGFTATRTDDVAQRAGVAKGTLYLYYPSKADLFKAVVQHFLADQITRAAETAATHTGTVSDIFREVFVPWCAGLIASPASGVFKLVIAEMVNFPELAEFYRVEVVEPGERILGGLLQRGIERGEFRPVDVASAVHSLMFPVVMLCLHKHSIGACLPLDAVPDPAQFLQQHIELMLRGLAAH